MKNNNESKESLNDNFWGNDTDSEIDVLLGLKNVKSENEQTSKSSVKTEEKEMDDNSKTSDEISSEKAAITVETGSLSVKSEVSDEMEDNHSNSENWSTKTNFSAYENEESSITVEKATKKKSEEGIDFLWSDDESEELLVSSLSKLGINSPKKEKVEVKAAIKKNEDFSKLFEEDDDDLFCDEKKTVGKQMLDSQPESIRLPNNTNFTNQSANLTDNSNVYTENVSDVVKSSLESNVVKSSLENNAVKSSLENNVINTPLENNVVNTPLENNVVNTPLESNVVNTPLESNAVNTPLESNAVNTPLENNVVKTPLETTSQIDNSQPIIMKHKDERSRIPVFQTKSKKQEIAPQSITPNTQKYDALKEKPLCLFLEGTFVQVVNTTQKRVNASGEASEKKIVMVAYSKIAYEVPEINAKIFSSSFIKDCPELKMSYDALMLSDINTQSLCDIAKPPTPVYVSENISFNYEKSKVNEFVGLCLKNNKMALDYAVKEKLWPFALLASNKDPSAVIPFLNLFCETSHIPFLMTSLGMPTEDLILNSGWKEYFMQTLTLGDSSISKTLIRKVALDSVSDALFIAVSCHLLKIVNITDLLDLFTKNIRALEVLCYLESLTGKIEDLDVLKHGYVMFLLENDRLKAEKFFNNNKKYFRKELLDKIGDIFDTKWSFGLKNVFDFGIKKILDVETKKETNVQETNKHTKENVKTVKEVDTNYKHTFKPRVFTQSFKKSIQPTSQPTTQPTSKPITKQTSQPTTQPISQQTFQQTTQPTTQPTTQQTFNKQNDELLKTQQFVEKETSNKQNDESILTQQHFEKQSDVNSSAQQTKKKMYSLSPDKSLINPNTIEKLEDKELVLEDLYVTERKGVYNSEKHAKSYDNFFMGGTEESGNKDATQFLSQFNESNEKDEKEIKEEKEKEKEKKQLKSKSSFFGFLNIFKGSPVRKVEVEGDTDFTYDPVTKKWVSASATKKSEDTPVVEQKKSSVPKPEILTKKPNNNNFDNIDDNIPLYANRKSVGGKGIPGAFNKKKS